MEEFVILLPFFHEWLTWVHWWYFLTGLMARLNDCFHYWLQVLKNILNMAIFFIGKKHSGWAATTFFFGGSKTKQGS